MLRHHWWDNMKHFVNCKTDWFKRRRQIDLAFNDYILVVTVWTQSLYKTLQIYSSVSSLIVSAPFYHYFYRWKWLYEHQGICCWGWWGSTTGRPSTCWQIVTRPSSRSRWRLDQVGDTYRSELGFPKPPDFSIIYGNTNWLDTHKLTQEHIFYNIIMTLYKVTYLQRAASSSDTCLMHVRTPTCNTYTEHTFLQYKLFHMYSDI